MFKWLRDIFVSEEDKMKKKIDVKNDVKVDTTKDLAEKIENNIEKTVAPVVDEVSIDANKDVIVVATQDVNVPLEKVKATAKTKASKTRSRKNK